MYHNKGNTYSFYLILLVSIVPYFHLSTASHTKEKSPFQNFLSAFRNQSGTLESAQKILQEQPAILKEKNVNGNTFLHIASGAVVTPFTLQAVELLKKVTLTKEDVDARNKTDQTPLHSALKNDNTAMITLLLDKGADVNAQDKNKKTPLHHAVLSGRPKKFVTLLLDKGANADLADDKGETPLWYAVRHNKKSDVVAILLEKSTTALTKKDENENTLLHHVAENFDADTLIRLLKTNAVATIHDRNKLGKTPLHVAAKRDNVTRVTALLDNNATIDALDNEGQTPLADALIENTSKVAALLVTRGANINKKDTSGKTPLDHANPLTRNSIVAPLQQGKRKKPLSSLPLLPTTPPLTDIPEDAPQKSAALLTPLTPKEELAAIPTPPDRPLLLPKATITEKTIASSTQGTTRIADSPHDAKDTIFTPHTIVIGSLGIGILSLLWYRLINKEKTLLQKEKVK